MIYTVDNTAKSNFFTPSPTLEGDLGARASVCGPKGGSRMNWRRNILFAIIMAILCAVPVLAQTAARVTPHEPANPHASPEARALLRYLYSISGHHTLAGQHNFPNSISRWTDRAYDLTGKYPALFGQDFGFSGGEDKDSVEARPAMIREIKRQYQNGALITLTWHEVRPTHDEPVVFGENILSHLSDFEWRELLTPGTGLNTRWRAQVSVVAGYLEQLRDAHVPVLWRPCHEMNGNWFWWGGRKGEEGSAALYRQEFDLLVNEYHLDNLIWVWNVNSPGEGSMGPGPYRDYFPGQKYVDVLSVDVYGPFQQSYYDDLVALAAGKLVALGEVGMAPTAEVLNEQPGWTWFMIWADILDMNPLEALRTLFASPRVLTRGDSRVAEPMAAIRRVSTPPSPQLVTPAATTEAQALLARLYAASGKATLSGQENSPGSPGEKTSRVATLTGERPAIYGEDLGIPGSAGSELDAARRAIADEAKREYQNGATVSLTWHAALPTGDPPPSNGSAQLTDFEWRELLTPGTDLYKLWCEQVDQVSTYLKKLQDAGIPVLWQPYPESNGVHFWWAGRKGVEGSSALYRQLYDRMVKTGGLRNLIWVWVAAAPGFGPNAPGRYGDFFPGLAYVDALAVNASVGTFRFPLDAGLALEGTGKVIGLGLTGKLPAPEVFAEQPDWAWFLVSPDAAALPEQSEALRALYQSPRVVSAAPQSGAKAGSQ